MKRQKRKTRRAPNKRQNSARRASKIVVPRTAEEFFAMSERSQDRWTRVTQAISKARAEDIPPAEAFRHFGLDPRGASELGKSALKKQGRLWVVRPNDHLLRVLVTPTTRGLTEIPTRNSREATLLGSYWAAVQRYLQTGDASALRRIRRKTVRDASGRRIRLIKDLEGLERLASAGVLSFESLYARAA